MRVFSIREIAESADLIVVGKVTAISSGRAAAVDEARWHTRLLEVKATVRVLRSYGKGDNDEVAAGSEIELSYLSMDPKHEELIINGPMFPLLNVGDIFAFPLARRSQIPGKEWMLLGEEDFGLLIPCVRQMPPALGSQSEKLWSELAQTFSSGEYTDIYKAACYLRNSYARKPDADFDGFLHQLNERVGQDEKRWIQIAVATYSSLGYPHPDITDLPGKTPTPQSILAAEAFHHIDLKDFAAKLIAESIAHMALHSGATANLIQQNYRDHPVAIRLIREALERGDPNAINVACEMIRKPSNPLLVPAVQASVNFLGGDCDRSAFGAVRSSCLLIAQFGGEKDFAFLLNELRKSQEHDLERYQTLWGACNEDYKRLPRVCRVVIDDKRSIAKDDRFCDRATWALARTTKIDFGLKAGRNADGTLQQSESDRDKAVAKAKAWLDRNLPKIP